jgi:hypothetical protein
MIFESFIEDSLKPVHGLLTKQRLTVFALALLFILPEKTELLEVVTQNPSIADLTTQLTKSLTSLPATTTFLMAAIIFFLSAKTHQTLTKISNKLQINKLNSIINKLRALELNEDNFFAHRSLEINFDWKLEKESAETEIKRLAALSEIFISAGFVCTYLSIQLDGAVLASLILIIISVLYSIEASRKTLILYITNIAPYKIAITRLNKIANHNIFDRQK